MSDKLTALQTYFQTLGKVIIAFSGGADSAFLARVAQDTLPAENILAVLADSATFPPSEKEHALKVLTELKIPHKVIFIDELGNPDFVKNDNNRCFFCREGLFQTIQTLANTMGWPHIVEGTNKDDEADYRPGKKAILELGIKSPLKELGFTKAEIRHFSKEIGLSTWNKPSMACLSSRIPYGETITPEKIHRIAESERYLSSIGLTQVRVRAHGDIARIEILPSEFSILFQDRLYVAIFKSLGFKYVTVDVEGYRTGSMNAVLGEHHAH